MRNGPPPTPTDSGLRFASLGIDLVYPWSGIGAIQQLDEDSDEPMDELLLREDYTRQIRNPVLRFLHGPAYGRRKLPLYAGLQERDELLAEIRRRTDQIDEPQEGVAESPAASTAEQRSAK